jgi:hypothetical protein
VVVTVSNSVKQTSGDKSAADVEGVSEQAISTHPESDRVAGVTDEISNNRAAYPEISESTVEIGNSRVDIGGPSVAQTLHSSGEQTMKPAPRWSSFQQNMAVRQFIKHLVAEERFSLTDIKRGMHHYLLQTSSATVELGHMKPNGLHVQEMFDPEMFRSGDVELPSDSYPLEVPQMDILHIQACARCGLAGSVHPECYFSAMRRCITHGWAPTVDTANIRPVYAVKGNYKSVTQYGGSVDKEFQKLVKHGVAVPAMQGQQGIISPMGAVIKNSDKVKAKVLTGISVCDQSSLAQANTALEAKGFVGIKARLTNDVTASGVNRAAYKPPFRYPGISDGIRIVRRNCFLIKADATRYFYLFPLARMAWWMFLIRYLGVLYILVRCMFGFAACPYYCSTWSAEFRSWVVQARIPCTHMMDDWLSVGSSAEEASANMARIKILLGGAGILFGDDKDGMGQSLVFLGLQLNTVRMTMSFDALQAKAVRIQLEEYLVILNSGRQIDATSVRSVAGKLGWYSEVLQSGRIHLRTWWAYYRFGRDLNPTLRKRLIADTEWWKGVVTKWENDTFAEIEYPILSASELLQNPTSIYVVQSDASGIDGFGYFHGYLGVSEAEFVSKSWSKQPDDSSAPEGWYNDPLRFTQSHDSEMKALDDFVRTTNIRQTMLIWVSDCLSAVWSVNKGRCKEAFGWITLTSILEQCDNKKLLLVALWVPREDNEYADYLSHLSAYLGRSEVKGFTQAYPGTNGVGAQEGDRA